MKHVSRTILALLVLATVFIAPACRTATAAATPAELKAVPMSQSVALETAIEKIQANDPAWVDASGNVRRDALLPILVADKAAWDQLDAFYNN